MYGKCRLHIKREKDFPRLSVVKSLKLEKLPKPNTAKCFCIFINVLRFDQI